MSPQLEISTFLASIRRRWRWLVALRAGTSAITGAAIALAVIALVFRLARPDADALLLVTMIAGMAAIVWAVRALRPVLAAPDDRRLARFVEERKPEFEDALVTAVQVREGDQAFASAVVAGAAMQARDIEPATVVRREELRRAAGRGAVACALLLVSGTASFGPLERALDAARVRLFPARIQLDVEPGNARVIAGRSLTLRARVTGVPEGFDPRPTVTIESGSKSQEAVMRRDGGAFVLTLPAVTRSFNYGVTAAGVRSTKYEVTVLHRPALQRIDIAYQYPSYTGMPARVEEDSGDVYAPAGTRITLRVHADKRLKGGTLKMGSRAVALDPGGDPRIRQTSFVVERDGSYRVDLTDDEGLRSDPSSEYFVRVTDDRPPEVRIVRPEGDRQVTALEEVEIEAHAEDDYRLGPLELVFAVGAQSEKVVPLNRGGGPSASGGHLIFLEDLKVRPGDMVRAYARVREARRGGRETRSEMLLLEVTPFDQEFALAQSQAMSGMSGGDLDSLIQAEKNILNATWNLLRRSAAGRSDADVTAVASAQGELRARALGQAVVRRSSGAGGDPMALAAAAMGRAQDALERKRLQDAVPHEMEALTQLGRALAENRRREVSQQRGAGGGGGNRSSQDLSALFDRELLRQQQTNYENRQSSSERRDEEGETDLQKRIRELARRQDELARAQRQLAAQRLTEDERRRQLERLTREQEELRQQAQQLARDLERQQGKGQTREQSESVREAAEEMRGSSNEMRRDNAQSASERGNRAAGRLRGAEQTSQGGQGQQQSMGELQMEAQQLAEAQRRIEEQQRQVPSGRPDGDRQSTGQQSAGQQGEQRNSQRRLADEQNRLADRAERLQRSARSMAAGGDDRRQRQAAEAAAREMERGEVARRMRENAQGLERQSGQSGEGTPEAQSPQADGSRAGEQQGSQSRAGEQQGSRPSEGQQQAREGDERANQPGREQQAAAVSSTLERVAERLGAAADAETRRLANEMARNRAAREELEERARQLERAQREGNAAAQEELRREIGRAEQMLRELQSGGSPTSGAGGSTPEEHEWSRSAPGLESFKQDFSRWEQLKRDIALALERRDLALARQLRARDGEDKVNAGSVEGLPESYRAKVARYFEALARAGRRSP